MDNQRDFDPIKIGYDPSGDYALFINTIIKIKGAKPYQLNRQYKDRIETQHQTIEGLDTILEFLDTRFAFNKLLPTDPLARAITKNAVYNILNANSKYVEPLKAVSILDIAAAVTYAPEILPKLLEFYK